MNQEELNRKLLEAAEKGDFDRIWELVELGADVNACDKYGRTALTLSAWKGHLTPELIDAFARNGNAAQNLLREGTRILAAQKAV